MRKTHLMMKIPDGKGGVERLLNVGACGTRYVDATHIPERVTCERCKLRIKFGQRGDTPNDILTVSGGAGDRP